MLNIHLIGCGRVFHTRLLPALGHLKVRHGFDTNVASIYLPENGNHYPDTTTPVFRSLADLFNFAQPRVVTGDIPVAYICTPPSTHYELARQCLQAGFHVLLEKPSVTTVEEALRLTDIARSNNVVLMESQPPAYHPLWRDYEREVKNAFNVHMVFGTDMIVDGWRDDPKELGAIGDYGWYAAIILNKMLDMRFRDASHALLHTGIAIEHNRNGVITGASGLVQVMLPEKIQKHGKDPNRSISDFTLTYSVGYNRFFRAGLDFWSKSKVLSFHKALNARTGSDNLVRICDYHNDDGTEQYLSAETWPLMLLTLIQAMENEKLRHSLYSQLRHTVYLANRMFPL